MPLEPLSPAAFAFIAHVDQAYASLLHSAAIKGQTSLGGRFLYAGELDGTGRAFACAGNIAGAATLAASADRAARKQAMRDGIVDFLVTSLDEALRILKNQIRKRETVAVCVGAATEAVESEMQERGVLPDLVSPAASHAALGAPQLQGRATSIQSVGVNEEAADEDRIWLTWRVVEAPALWLPQLDAVALACLAPGAASARRWLQLAPRYLGRLAQGARVLRPNQEFAEQFIAHVKERIATGEITAPIEVEVGPWGQSQLHRLLATR